MATFEERLTAIEQEHAELKHDNAELKQKIELQTIAIGGLVNKSMLERLNEKNDKIFQALVTHDGFTNQQLSELRERGEVQVEGKIAGLQTEMRQSFEAVGARFETVATKDDFQVVNARLDSMDTRFDQIMLALTALAPKPEQGG
jgi:chromosome segregation ATPase